MAVEAVDALSDVLSTQPVSAISPSTRILARPPAPVMGSPRPWLCPRPYFTIVLPAMMWREEDSSSSECRTPTCPIERWNGLHQSCLLCCPWDFCPAWLVPDTKCFRSFPCPPSHLCPAGDVHGPATPHSTCSNTH